MRTRIWFVASVIVTAISSGTLPGQDTDVKQLEMAFQWSRKQFEKEIGEVEQEYERAIRAAQATRAEAIKLARVRYKQGLEFLNVNPALPQPMRKVINEEMIRIVRLPEPVAQPMPEGRGSDPAPPEPKPRTISVGVDAPDNGWSIRILQAKKVNNEIWVLSALQHGPGIADFVTTPVADSATVVAGADLEVRHFVLNKTWSSKSDEEAIKFIGGVPDLGRDWALGEVLQLGRGQHK
jgi:hypothetical protein